MIDVDRSSLNISFISAVEFNMIAQRERKHRKSLQLYSLIITQIEQKLQHRTIIDVDEKHDLFVAVMIMKKVV